ncbi:MAG: sigma 54-interacting transcriptional regulator [Spirochaetales bacterium]|nr:sigma 54-interacting transcriptional regulator [Spirochaetales bacterium]
MFSSPIDASRLETLIQINTLINTNYTDVKMLLTRILESATKLTNGEASSLLLVNPENNKLYFEIALGSKGAEMKRFSLNMGEGIAGWVAERNTSLIVNDVANDERFYSDISKQIGFPTSSILAVPMRVKDRCVGVLEIVNKIDRKPFNQDDLQWLEVFATQAALAVQNAHSFQRVREEVHFLQDQIRHVEGYHTFIGSSKIIQEKLSIAKRVADTTSSVLILGESGVGKELFAEQIHLNSSRAGRPFIRVNCAALPEHLLESELFGHVKGAFTDATADRRGRFEIADGGTIFLDEIGDVPLNLQAKLLRVLQDKVFEKVGSSEPVKVDVRIIAATNKDIEQELAEGRFRHDLYYRLNVLPLYVPPLRERKEDIPELIDFFLKRLNHETKKQIRGFTSSAIEALLSYSWPGNVRELENVVERAVVICGDEYIEPRDLILSTVSSTDDSAYSGKKLKDAVNLFKRHYIQESLEMNNWSQTRTAKVLGIQRTYLSRLVKELQIDKD